METKDCHVQAFERLPEKQNLRFSVQEQHVFQKGSKCTLLWLKKLQKSSTLYPLILLYYSNPLLLYYSTPLLLYYSSPLLLYYSTPLLLYSSTLYQLLVGLPCFTAVTDGWTNNVGSLETFSFLHTHIYR